MELAQSVYEGTRSLPEQERFGLVSQMRRSAVSIPSNIAEGYARHSLPDYIKHLRIARGSLAELSTQHELAVRVGLLRDDPALGDLIEEEGRILNALIRSLERREESA
jgi:four helix bundle protein